MRIALTYNLRLSDAEEEAEFDTQETVNALASASVGIAAVMGFIAVALGAFGAHALRARLTPDLLVIWKTANEYHFYHVLALLLVGLLARQTPTTNYGVPAVCFLVGESAGYITGSVIDVNGGSRMQ